MLAALVVVLRSLALIRCGHRAVALENLALRQPPSQTWRTFLTNHLTSLVSLDFFTVPTVTGRVLFVLVRLSHHRRRLVHLRITEHPTAAWTAQRLIPLLLSLLTDPSLAGERRAHAPTCAGGHRR
jgi:hypothetical protein